HDEKLVLPTKRVKMNIPLNATINSVSISGSNPINLGTVNVPLFNAIPKFLEEFIYLNSSALSNYVNPIDEPIWFQSKNATFKIIYIDVIPIIFDAETKNVILYKNLTIKLNYETEQNGILIGASTLKRSCGVNEKISAYAIIENTIAETALFKIRGKVGTVMGGELISIDNSFNINSGVAVKINIDFNDKIDIPGEYFFEVEVYDSTGKIGETGNQFTVFSDQPDISKASVTDDWQTYRNEKLGFELKYPEDWEHNFKNTYSSFQGSALMENSVAFRPIDDRSNVNFEVAFSSSPIKNNDYCLNNKEEIIYINNVKAVKCELSLDPDNYKDEHAFGYEGNLGAKVFLSKDSSHNYVIYFKDETMGDYEIVLNQILSTFKFTNQNTNIEDIIKGGKEIEYLKDFKFQNLPDYVFQEQ
ncbi:hypothetical protein KAK05_03025, partial [Candidatus Parcubacteria bacterium]|nr:hypothetical protein [Candidatus Parcubacteria bacterium]